MKKKMKSDCPLDAATCSGLGDSLDDLIEYLTDRSKEHKIMATLGGYSVTGDILAGWQGEWAVVMDSWIAQITALMPKCKLCDDKGYYDGGHHDGEPCRICSQNAQEHPTT